MKFVALFLLCISQFSFAESIEALTTQAQNQNVEAQIILGNKLANGDGVAASRVDAIYWLEQAAQSGSQIAAIDLANLYLDNSSNKSQPEKAIYWLTQLAINDNVQAQVALAKFYETTQSTPSNLDLAEIWYQVSAPNSGEGEEGYARILEKQFNAQRAKQVSSIDQLEVAFDDSSIELSPIAQSKNASSGSSDSIIYIAIALGFAFIGLLFWHLKSIRKMAQNSLSSQSDEQKQKKQLEDKIRQYESTIKQQKRQLETLYRQFKKQQAMSSQPVQKAPVSPQNQKLALACALFGYKPDSIPDSKQIKVRYKQLCKIYHPDLKGSEEDMKRLNGALKVILNTVNK
ncbi:J domain-containing protein [Vibrio atypicus]|uniref:J domain-containing protein n=1 Tax=Vibrio atypicus TaxID=558271 RepID=UPI0013590D06|nr:SEL1-like repeat protein [Vibrio atypicus]